VRMPSGQTFPQDCVEAAGICAWGRIQLASTKAKLSQDSSVDPLFVAQTLSGDNPVPWPWAHRPSGGDLVYPRGFDLAFGRRNSGLSAGKNRYRIREEESTARKAAGSAATLPIRLKAVRSKWCQRLAPCVLPC
jgi:hypothetical protein